MPKRISSVLILLFLLSGLLLPTPGLATPAPAVEEDSPRALTPIYDIQYTTIPGTDGTYPSLLVGQTITTTGVVYAIYSGRGFCIADAAGPWHSIYVYYPSGTMPELGDLVQVQGLIQEYYGLTELSDYATYTILSSGNPIYAPSIVTTADIPFGNPDVSEPYESVLVEIHNITVTEEPDDYWIWTFTDASADSSKADDWGYRADPAIGASYTLLRGSLFYDYDEYKVMPRDADDLVEGSHLAIEKIANLNVAPGGLLTYTISLQNNTLLTLTNVVITDAIPISNAVVVRVLDGGVLTDDTISWSVSSLPVGGQLGVRFVVTATGSVGDLIINRAYAAWATNWPNSASGGPLVTVIGNYTPIPMIQGDGYLSPLWSYEVRTQGIVVGFFEGNWSGGGGFDGFFIQDPYGDGITTTSDGIYVNYGNLNVNVSVGDWVTVTGTVNESNEYDNGTCLSDECQTEILVDSADDVEVWGSGSIPPLLIEPLGDIEAGRAYYESLEGMLLTLAETGTVVGPTSYGTVIVVPGSLGVERVIRTGPYAGMPVGLRHWERYGDMPGGDPPNLIVGSVITGAVGPLAWSYGNYIVTTQPGVPWSEIYAAPVPSVPSWPDAGPDQLSMISFNVENHFDTIDDPGKSDPIVSPTDYALKRDKIARSIAAANCPIIVGLQEVEKLEVVQDIAAVLQSTYACTYTATLIEGLDERGIDVGYLTRDDRITIQGTSQYQDCTDYDTGLGQGDCPAGQQLLYSRIPLVMTTTVQFDDSSAQVVWIVNHLKSKLSRSGDPESAQWRLLQAQSLATLTNRLISDDPDILLIVMGDLNDFEDAPPLEALYQTGLLTNTWYTLEPQARYSYIYRGVSQILDHVLVSPAMQSWLEQAGVLHYNADYPHLPFAEDPSVVWRTTDHDPPAATFVQPPDLSHSTKTADRTIVQPGEQLAYTLALSNTGQAATVAITDVLPPEVTLLTATLPAGLVYSDGQLLWSGALSPGHGMDFTFEVQVHTNLADGQTFTNVLWIDDGLQTPFAREAIVTVEIPCTAIPGAGFDWTPTTPIAGQPLTLTAWVDPASWQSELVDGTGATGQFAALALDTQGWPHVAYYDTDNASMEYAWHDGSTWHLSTVEQDGGQYASLALDAADQPHLAYYDPVAGALKYAHHDGANWQIETVDVEGDAGYWNSLALDSAGHPCIAYHLHGYGSLRLACYDGSVWQIETVDSSGVAGRYAALALDGAGHPHVSYYVAFSGDLRYATHDGSVWQIETVDSAGDVGEHTALALDGAGHPHISYLDGSGTLKYATHDGSDWQAQSVSAAGTAAADTALALDLEARPHLAYYDAGGSGLMLAHYDGSAWLVETVDTAAAHASGSQVSLALDTMDRPHLAYHDASGADLRYAWLPDQPTPPFSYTWSLGDGAVSTDAVVTHTYAAAGAYTVTLTATNACSTVVVEQSLQVAPVAGWKVYLPLMFK